MLSPDFVHVTARPDWFDRPRRFDVAPGASLADIVVASGIRREWWAEHDVAIDGEIIAPANWPRVRPKPGKVITIHPPRLQGGGGNSTAKNVITAVATIAIIAGAAFISGGALVPLFGSAFAAGTIGANLAAAGFGIAGQLALRALAPPPIAANNKNRSFKPETVAGITGNPIAPFDYLPRVLGSMKASPPFVAQPFTLLENQVVTAYAIVGLAGNHLIEDVEINGVAASEFPGVTIETQDGSDSVTDLALVTRCGFEQSGDALSEFDLVERSGELRQLADQSTPDNSVPQYHYFQTQGTADEAHLRLAFPAGLYKNTEERAGCAFRIEFKLASSSAWIKGPEFHVSPTETFAKAFRQRVRLVWGAIPGSAVPSSTDATFYAYGYTGSASYNWSAHSHFRNTGTSKPAKNVIIDRDGINIYLSGATFPKGVYDVRIKRSMAYTFSDFSTTAYTWNGNAANAAFFDYYINFSFRDVRIQQQRYVGSVQVEAFTTIRDTHPIGDKTGLTLIAIKAQKAKIDSISATFTSRAPTFNGIVWGSTPVPTSNPAALYRDVLLGSLNARPLASTMVDDVALGDAYLNCEAAGYVCSGVIQGYSVEQALQAIAAAAFGMPRQEEKWSILLERDTSGDDITQLLSPRLYRNLVIERSFEPVPHAIRAEFLNENFDYRADEEIVYRAGYDANSATLYSAIRYDLFTDPDLVTERAAFDLAQLQYRQNRYVLELDWAHLVSGRGTLVGLETNELATATGSAYITQVVVSGGNITGLVLDAPVTTPASFAGIIIQGPLGTTTTKQISEVTESRTIEFVTPFANPGIEVIDAGFAVVVGSYLGRVVRRCKVFDVERLSDLQARVTLLDEAPEIYA